LRIATFNVENLFRRPAAMNQSTFAAGRPALDDLKRLTELVNRKSYSDATKTRIIEIMGRYPGLLDNQKPTFIRLQEIREKLVRRRQAGPRIEISGRADWVGWFELVREDLNDDAILNTGRIIKLVGADILCAQEVEDRTALRHFNDQVMPNVSGTPYDHAMVIEGNDDRGIDVAVLHRADLEMTRMASHAEDVDGEGLVFSRDCPEYEFRTPAGNTLLVMVNHFKSRSGGGGPLRKRQAQRVKQIYQQRLAEGIQHIAIVGDLNDAPNDAPLQPLLNPAVGLTDIFRHPAFVPDSRPGTYGNGTANDKLDYVLLSPALSALVTAGGVERRGVWGGTNGTLFPHLPEITGPEKAASDHAVVFADINI
jgi:endonuclease/exonuclease/phosphatase family metal-dependent hydrolase